MGCTKFVTLLLAAKVFRIRSFSITNFDYGLISALHVLLGLVSTFETCSKLAEKWLFLVDLVGQAHFGCLAILRYHGGLLVHSQVLDLQDLVFFLDLAPFCSIVHISHEDRLHRPVDRFLVRRRVTLEHEVIPGRHLLSLAPSVRLRPLFPFDDTIYTFRCTDTSIVGLLHYHL